MTFETARSGSDPPRPGARPAFSHCLRATPDSVGRLRRGVTDFARAHGAAQDALASVRLAVSEAITNAVLHAYRDAPEPGPVLVTATVEERALLVTVSDEGCGMNARFDSPGLGHGMALMAMHSDTFALGARANGNSGVVLRMRFALAG
jgi:anti-sigma regulatory factor (Ser/Thr protein kinase)